MEGRTYVMQNRDEAQAFAGQLTPEAYKAAGLADSSTAIVLDMGSSMVRAGYSSESAPRLIFPPVVTRGRERRKRNGVWDEVDVSKKNFVGYEAFGAFARSGARSLFEGNLMLNNYLIERLFDEVLVKLGLAEESEIMHPFVVTETVCQPNKIRASVVEILFEAYNAIGVVLGIDALFSYLYNSHKDASGSKEGPIGFRRECALIVDSSHTATHVLPIVNRKLAGSSCKRILVGGQQQTNTLQKRLQMNFPHHAAALTAARAEMVKENVCETIPTPFYADFLQKLRADQDAFERLKVTLKVPDALLPGSAGTASPVEVSPEEIERKKQLRAEAGRRLFEMMQAKRRANQAAAGGNGADGDKTGDSTGRWKRGKLRAIFTRQEADLMFEPLEDLFELESVLSLLEIVVQRQSERDVLADYESLGANGSSAAALPSGPGAAGANANPTGASSTTALGVTGSTLPATADGASDPAAKLDAANERLIFQAEDAFYRAVVKRKCRSVDQLKHDIIRAVEAVERAKKLVNNGDKVNAILEAFRNKKADDALLATADNKLTVEQIKEKRRLRVTRAANAVRDKAREQREAEKQRLADEMARRLQFKEEDPEAYLKELRAERDELLNRIKRREAARLSGSDRRSLASRNRMRLLAQQADGGAGGPKGGSDTFGMNDSDWDVYRDMQGDNSEEEDEEATRLEKIDEEILSMVPHDEIYKKPRGFDGLFYVPDSLDEIPLVFDRFRTMETVWQPSIIGVDQVGLAEAMTLSINSLPESLRPVIVQEVFLTGGVCNSPGFQDRVYNELRMAMPSGWGDKIQTWTAADPSLDAWRGAALFAQKGEGAFRDALISRQDYEEMGAEYLKEHLCSNQYVPSPPEAKDPDNYTRRKDSKKRRKDRELAARVGLPSSS
ncbi:Actin-related protein 5 [Porphyridium purpureum]|uniref:Actin-related protein 5 n=1 Tax=Porphyridium purpureum TaxID=35688 RepID=A0A5J4Z5B4_PORPP|nr:Actin-related protein 5 [Porphyridium purpureum]|eukprot:POR8545..scf295_1